MGKRGLFVSAIKRLALAAVLTMALGVTLAQNQSKAERNDYSLKKGFRGFVELGMGVASGGMFVMATPAVSFGYQLTPLWYIGGGLSANDYIVFSDEVKNDFHFGLPIFVNSRLDVGKKHTFYVDARLGGMPLLGEGDKGGFYDALTLGVRFLLPGRWGALSLGLGYECTLGAGINHIYHGGLELSQETSLSTVMLRVAGEF